MKTKAWVCTVSALATTACSVSAVITHQPLEAALWGIATALYVVGSVVTDALGRRS